MKVEDTWKNEETGKYVCPDCENQYTKMGISTHIMRKHTKKELFENCNPKGVTGKKPENWVPWNKGKTKETDKLVLSNSKKVSEGYKSGRLTPSFLGKTHSNESKKLISEKLKGNYNGKHRGDRQSYFKEIRMDSTWEVKVAEYLTENELGFEYGEKVFDLGDSTYRPDFFIPSENKYIEVKGYWRQPNLEKFFKFKLLFRDINIEVWDKDKLTELKIL